MAHFLGSIISGFALWLLLGLLGDWAYWWDFGYYLSITYELVDFVRQFLIALGQEFKS
jgi:hypothetical protein